MLEHIEEILERYFDERLATLAVTGLTSCCDAAAAVYDLQGKRLWHSDGTDAFPPIATQNATLESVLRLAREATGAVIEMSQDGCRLCAPIAVLEGTIGYLVLEPRGDASQIEAALPKLKTLTGVCGVFLGETLVGKRTGADLAAELSDRYEELNLVYTLTEALALSKEEKEALHIICDSIAGALSADLLLLVVPTLGYRIFYSQDGPVENPPQAFTDELFKELRSAPRTTASNYLQQNSRYVQLCKPYSHVACTPLDVDGDFGILALLREDFDARLYMPHVKMLEAVSRQISIFLTNRKIISARQQLFDLTIFGLARLAESRDMETGEHLERVSRYCKVLAEECLKEGLYPEEIDQAFVETIFSSSPLHDIGKVGIPDAILNKPGKLTPEEFDLMKKHAEIGGKTLHDIERRLNWGESTFLTMGRKIAYSHHEKWDGSGYPYGIKGDDIFLPGRIMAVADVYDALTSKRCYKDAMSHDRARNIIIEGRGTHFDPALVDIFLVCEPIFLEIRDLFHGGKAKGLAEDRFVSFFDTPSPASLGNPE